MPARRRIVIVTGAALGGVVLMAVRRQNVRHWLRSWKYGRVVEHDKLDRFGPTTDASTVPSRAARSPHRCNGRAAPTGPGWGPRRATV